jgi:signal transduction histidine kinase
LQARLRLAVIGAAVLFLLHAASLGALTRFLGKDAQYLKEAIESALVTKNIELDLIRYDRVNEETDGQARSARSDAIAAKLRDDLTEVRRYINTPDEEQLVNEVGRLLDDYLVAQKRARAQGLENGQIRSLLAPEFAATLAATERLVDLNVEQANELLQQATNWYRIATFLAVAVAVVFGLGLSGALLGFDRWVRRPLGAAAAAIARFGSGDRASRADETGPIEVRQIADTFNDMAATLARQENDRIAFIGGVAHDLRGPVTAIQMANALLDPAGPLRGERAGETRAILLRQTARLERMIGDFLDAVRIHAGHLELRSTPLDLVDVVRDAVEQYRPFVTDRDIEPSLPAGPVMVTGDAMRLGQVLTNLLSNAVKYSPTGGAIKVSLEATSDEAIVAVTDQGIGIQPGEREHIFEPFRRTGASRELVPGVGLGLSIAKRIIEAHGGRIEVISTPGRGSTFRVHLPITTKAAAEG